MIFKRTITGILTAAMTLSGIGAFNTMANDNVKIFIAGDSTACEYGSDDNYALPRAGWGMYLGNYVQGAEVVDLAKSGRSSKSLTVEEEYKTLINDMDKGDYVLIQFGHNDAKKSKEEDIKTRYTDPEGDKDMEGSFKNSLYKNYIKPAQDKGAIPILLTPISRRSFEDEGNVKDTHGLYDDAVRELGTELNIPVVDATNITMGLYQELGVEGTAVFHAIYKDVKKGDKGHDNTHLNHYGAKMVAYGIATSLSNINGIENYIEIKEGEYEGIEYVTRAEFTYGIVRIIGADYSENTNGSFTDVSADSEYAAAIATAKELGIVTGDEKGNFNPSKAINLQEMCTITARALEYAGVELNKDKSVLANLQKNDELKPYAEESVAALMNLWGEAIPSYANPREIMEKGSVYTVYSLVYDEINEADENAEAQSIDEIEKVE